MKLLYLASRQHFLESHAGFSHSFNMSKALAGRGHDVTLVMRPPKQDIPGLRQGEELVLGENYRVRFVDWRLKGNFINYPKAILAVKKLGREAEMVHERYELHGNVGSYLARRRKLPFVLEANSPFVEEFFRPKTPLFWLFSRARKTNFSSAGKVVVQANQLRDIFSRFCPQERIRVVSNGVDPTLFDPHKVPEVAPPAEENNKGLEQDLEEWTGNYLKNWILGDRAVAPEQEDKLLSMFRPQAEDVATFRNFQAATTGKNVILFVGSFRYWHGVLDLIKAFPAVVKEQPETCLVLVGNGELEPQARELVARLEAKGELPKGSVFFPGTVSYSLLPLYLKRATVCTAPFNFTLGHDPKKLNLFEKYGMWWSPLKIFEYMSMEKPVVTPPLGSLPHYLGETGGEFYQHGNALGLASAITALLQDKKRAEELGRRLRDRAIKMFSWERKAAETEAVYQELMS